MVARAKNQYVWDADGNQYLDFFGGIVTVSVGHCNDQVNAEVHRQLDTLQHVSTVFANEPQAALAKKIASLTPGGQLTKSFFTNSGTEANETAILAARCYTGNTEIVALRHSYHGRSAVGHGAHRPGRVAAGAAAGRRRARAQRLLLPLPVRPDLSELRSAMRAGHGRADPHHHQRARRRLHRRADPGRGRLHHASEGVFPDRRRRSCATTAAFSSATKCRPAGAAPAASGSASSSRASSPDIITGAKGLGQRQPHRPDRGHARKWPMRSRA